MRVIRRSKDKKVSTTVPVGFSTVAKKIKSDNTLNSGIILKWIVRKDNSTRIVSHFSYAT